MVLPNQHLPPPPDHLRTTLHYSASPPQNRPCDRPIHRRLNHHLRPMCIKNVHQTDKRNCILEVEMIYLLIMALSWQFITGLDDRIQASMRF
jgi:hypothetical protein